MSNMSRAERREPVRASRASRRAVVEREPPWPMSNGRRVSQPSRAVVEREPVPVPVGNDAESGNREPVSVRATSLPSLLVGRALLCAGGDATHSGKQPPRRGQGMIAPSCGTSTGAFKSLSW